MNKAYLLIGGNMGSREGYLSAATEQIGQHCGPIQSVSSMYQTAAWGLEDQDAFLNQVLEIDTRLDAKTLLQQILLIEEALGRKRDVKYGPRIIDIDILFFNDDVVKTDSLTIPHPQMQNRRFVLEPLAEIAPGKVHPFLHKTVATLLAECPDKLAVQKFP
jgi:2-amino-4-hydroxy-6-hydroxymethyldihydropteridine diphosphokinase